MTALLNSSGYAFLKSAQNKISYYFFPNSTLSEESVFSLIVLPTVLYSTVIKTEAKKWTNYNQPDN